MAITRSKEVRRDNDTEKEREMIWRRKLTKKENDALKKMWNEHCCRILKELEL